MRLRNLLLISTALMPLAFATAYAGPDGAQVVGGAAAVHGQGTANVIVNQSSDRTIINWRMFDIGVNEKTTFNQPNSNSIALNRVTGGMGPTQILGSLSANGKVFVVNRDGIIFGAGAVINTAGFLATTSDIRNEDFMAGRFNFNIPGRPDASIVNMGTITATSGGFAALVAPGVRNSGTIVADLGTVGLAAANTFSLDFYGDKLITLGIGSDIAGQVKDVKTGETLKSLVTNEGKLRANGGRVELTAAAARHVVDSVINTSGVIEADSVGLKDGQIVLSAATAAPSGGYHGLERPGGASGLPKQTVRVSGTLSASGKQKGTKGGKIVVTGENIEVAGATIDASGASGGGKVLIGGDWGGGKPDKSLVSNQSAVQEANAIPNATTVSVDAATRIDASARDGGHGGKVVLWADDRLSFAGTILALGGKEFGNGGFVETSAHSVSFAGTINAGRGGAWLLDPADVPINSGEAATINAALNAGTSFTVTTATTGGGNGDIIVNSQISWNTSATFTMIAFRNIRINDAGPLAGTIVNTGAGKLVMRADSTGTGTGTIDMPGGTTSQRINWTGSTGTVTVYYNPASYTSPTNFTVGNGHIGLASPSQLTAYMLVNSKTDLINIATNLSGTFALGKDIDATGGAMAPLGNISPTQFTGILDGNGGLGVNHTISNVVIAPNVGTTNVGLFGVIGAGGIVRNLNIDSATITADPTTPPPGQFVGVLAGSNAGTISNVIITDSTISNGTQTNGVIAGGLVGQNGIFGPGGSMGTIANSIVAVNVTVGNSTTGQQNNLAGGLVGSNPGTIDMSFATGDVSGGANSFIGGLVGRNDGTITSSGATGNATLGVATGAGAGGFVGFNFGTITGGVAIGNVSGGSSTDVMKAGGIGGFVGLNASGGQITGGVAGLLGGTVTGSANTMVGGFAGSNQGTITGGGSLAAVTGGDNITGGFVGFNSGTISGGVAAGDVSGGGFAVGGFAGENAGTITASSSGGFLLVPQIVTSTAADGDVGGFAGSNRGTISFGTSFATVTGRNAGGFVNSNDSSGTISNSTASGTVSVGNDATAGGFVGGNFGTISNSQTSVAVTGGSNTYLGGFVAGNFGTIDQSSASGSVTASGPNAVAGGFAGISFDAISNSTASGAVSGTSSSYLGGFVGINTAKITDSTSSGNVSGSGTNNIVGGFTGVNFGFVDPSHSSGNASSGANSVVGIFIGANAALQFPGGQQAVGTHTPDSTGTGTATGGPGSTVGGQVGQTYPTSGLPDLPANSCSLQGGATICGGTLFNPNGTQDQPDDHDRFRRFEPLLNFAKALVHEFLDERRGQDEVVNTKQSSSGGPGGNSKGGGNQGGGNVGRPAINVVPPVGLGPLPSGMPPITETRFVSNEVVMQLGLVLTPQQIEELQRRYGLRIISTQQVGLLGRTVYRFLITGGLGVRDVIAGIQNAIGARVSVQPSYSFDLAQPATAPNGNGDSAQYIVEKLQLAQAHAIASGKNIKVAVIDSEIDEQHPDLQGVIAATYDALPSDDRTAHPHGTGMAGAIASHKRLLGVAPGAKLLAIRAFGVSSGGAQGTSMNIVKGLEWAVKEGAQVINMSFAGPRDPLLEQAIRSLKDRGIILVAAAGNAGPKSPPLFPAADPNVIAVSATDVDDKTYRGAVRGKHVAIAAPGVDILVPAPAGGYQLTTGTSVAAAHVSGVVALLLERNGRLSPNEVRSILAASAKKLPQGRNEVGAGLIDPVQALSKAAPKQAQVR